MQQRSVQRPHEIGRIARLQSRLWIGSPALRPGPLVSMGTNPSGNMSGGNHTFLSHSQWPQPEEFPIDLFQDEASRLREGIVGSEPSGSLWSGDAQTPPVGSAWSRLAITVPEIAGGRTPSTWSPDGRLIVTAYWGPLLGGWKGEDGAMTKKIDGGTVTEP
jgi:hypothetical protein